jgi:protein-tyrosine-phosphatase
MSAALFDRAAQGRHQALSAGSEADPGGHVHPEVVEVMRELGIDLSDRRPQRLTRELADQADVVITMGCGDACPVIPGKRYIEWDLPDPKDRPIDEVRATRDDTDLSNEVPPVPEDGRTRTVSITGHSFLGDVSVRVAGS